MYRPSAPILKPTADFDCTLVDGVMVTAEKGDPTSLALNVVGTSWRTLKIEGPATMEISKFSMTGNSHANRMWIWSSVCFRPVIGTVTMRGRSKNSGCGTLAV